MLFSAVSPQPIAASDRFDQNGPVKALALTLSLLTAVVICIDFGLAKWAGMPGGPLKVFSILIADSFLVTKMVIGLLVILLFVVLTTGSALVLAKRRNEPSSFLSALSITLPFLGGAAGAFDGLIIWQAVVNTHTTNFLVVAPSIASALVPIGLGLFVGALAAIANAVLSTRQPLDRGAA